jgi:hypothetical protein
MKPFYAQSNQYDMKTAGILFRDIERGNLKPDRRSYDLMLRGTH